MSWVIALAPLVLLVLGFPIYIVLLASTSVVALSTVVPYRVLPLLQTRRPPERSTKAPAFRRSAGNPGND